jgi:TonB-linked SusC/RagA family outer membrane protein
MKKSLFTLLLLFMGVSYLVAQRSISGKVSDNNGTSLVGATVLISGTSSGTVTDENGNFALTVPNDATSLTVSFTGYVSKNVLLSADSYYNISISEDVKQLNEVVVTALGIERNRNDLSVAAQTISSDKVNQVRTNDFVSNLSGKVAGLDIRTSNTMGGSTNVVLRGMKSITGNNQALFVVDGIPVSNSTLNTTDVMRGFDGYDYGSSAADINPSDIESITVLKGAAAALYGSRGANGVIIITTKKGSKDNFGVTVNSGVTWGTIDKSTMAKYQKEYGAGYSQDAYGYSGNPGFLGSDYFTPGTEEPFVPFTEDASFGAKFDPNLLVYDWWSLDPNSPRYKQKTPWVAAKNGPDKFFDNSISSNQSVMLEGGGKTATYKLGYTRNDEKGIMPNSSLNKNMFSFSGSITPSKKFTISSSINFTNQNGLGRYVVGYGGQNISSNLRQWYQTNVDVLELKKAYEENEQNITWNWAGIDSDSKPIYWDNPYFTRYKSYENDSRNRYFGYIKAQYNILPELAIIGRAGADLAFDQQEERKSKQSVDLGYYSIYNRSSQNYNYDLFANYSKNLSEMFSLDVTAGTNIRRSYISSVFNATNTDLVVDGLYSISNSSVPPNPPSESYVPVGVDGLFATATIGINKMLFVDGTIRRDQSTTLPAANNTYIYPAVSLGFLFSDLLHLDVLNYGKIRAAYSEVGNDAPALSVYDVYSKPVAWGNVPLFSLPTRKNNAELKPERTKSLEFGLDLGFFQNRIGLELSYYDAKTFNQIMPIQITGATGYTSKFINSGEVSNKGIEAILNLVPVRTNDMEWSFNFNFAKNKNEVVSLYDANTKQIVMGTSQGGVSLAAIPGLPLGVIKGRGHVYHANGQPLVDEDGYYVTKADQILGNVNPDWIGGVGTSFRWKDLSIGVQVDAKVGGNIFSLDRYYGDYSGLYPETAGLNDKGKPVRSPVADGGGIKMPGVKEDGTPNDVYTSATNSDEAPFGINASPGNYIYDATFVKLREVNLTYSFKNILFANSKFVKGIDLSLVGRNLAILYKDLPYADPEQSYSAGNLSGHSGGTYPAVKTIGFNLRLKF